VVVLHLLLLWVLRQNQYSNQLLPTLLTLTSRKCYCFWCSIPTILSFSFLPFFVLSLFNYLTLSLCVCSLCYIEV
jgi:hypothetical protein